jgi:UDP-N-acetylglucosamine--N-acetylmuramyl-(pentapeptide) pyrophosphoryl-undecaprenol N-acetylglucosamine transferase
VTKPTLLIAGGGTGGHVFPGLAVAEAMQALADVEVVFCGSERGLEGRVIPDRGFRLERLDVEPMKGGGLTQALRGGLVASRATARSFRMVRDLRPKAALSTGGYASGPATLAAALLGVPVAVLELDSTAGLANRLLSAVAKRAYVAWEGAEAAFRPETLRRYGVPIRTGFGPRPYPVSHGSLEAAGARILIMGGSQGAGALNERLPRTIASLSAGKRALNVVHQAGRGRDAAVRAAYAQEGVERVTVVPFIDDVAREIAEADVVVARAGAVTIAEVTAVGRASILVPLPHAANDHQAKNAEDLARSGAAVCLRQEGADSQAIARCLHALLSDDCARMAMADASRARGRPDAAHDIAADLLAFASIAPRNGTRGGTRGGTRLAF